MGENQLRSATQGLPVNAVNNNVCPFGNSTSPLFGNNTSPNDGNTSTRGPRLSSGFPGTRQELLKYVEENVQILNTSQGCDALRRAMMEWFPLLGSDDGNDYSCPICSGRLEEPAGCGHCSFRSCKSCLIYWCKKQLTDRGQSNCPQCRAEITMDTIRSDEELRQRLHEEPTFSELVNQVKEAKQDNKMLWRLVRKQGEEIDRLKEALLGDGNNNVTNEQQQLNAATANAGMIPMQNHQLGGDESFYRPPATTQPMVQTAGGQPPAAPGPYTSYMVEGNAINLSIPPPPDGSGFPRLRFSVGDRVLCRIGPEPNFPISRWVPGRVVQQWYREAPNYCAPYLVRLDDGRHTATPLDNNFVIRRYFEISRTDGRVRFV